MCVCFLQRHFCVISCPSPEVPSNNQASVCVHWLTDAVPVSETHFCGRIQRSSLVAKPDRVLPVLE
jgi:hypothetical protein